MSYAVNQYMMNKGMSQPDYPAQESSGPAPTPGLQFYYAGQQAEADKARMFLDRINAINLPTVNPMQGIPSQYTHQQRTQQAGGLNPMQMYQNSNQYQNQLGGSMQPMQMLNQYRQTGMVSEPQTGMSQSQQSQLGTALGAMPNTRIGSTSSTGGK